jgi:hypothetical protein
VCGVNCKIVRTRDPLSQLAGVCTDNCETNFFLRHPPIVPSLLLPSAAESLVKLHQRQTLAELGLHQIKFR